MQAAAGKVVQVTGPVVDVEFPPGQLPNIYSALKVTNPFINDKDENLILEVDHIEALEIGNHSG